MLTRLNEIRRSHPSLQRLRNIAFHPTDDDSVICYSKTLPADLSPTGLADTVICVVNLDPHSTRETMVHLDMPALGMDYSDAFTAHDLLSGGTWHWGEHVYVRLGPEAPAHVVHVRRA